MAHLSKIGSLAGAAVVFAGMAFGQAGSNTTCGTTTATSMSGVTTSSNNAIALETPLIRVEGTTELVGRYQFMCSASAGGATINILDILSLPVTSKSLGTTGGNTYTEALAEVTGTTAPAGTAPTLYQGVVSGSQVTFSQVAIPTGGATVVIENIRVNASGLSLGTGTPPAVTESAFISGINANSTVTTSAPVAYAFTGLSVQTAYKTVGTAGSKGVNNFLVCQGYNKNSAGQGLAAAIDVGENFATAFKGLNGMPPATGSFGNTGSNTTSGSEFTNNTETGFVPPAWPSTAGASNIANTATMIQVTFNNIPSGVSLYVPTTILADQNVAPVFNNAMPPMITNTPVYAGELVLVSSPSSPTTVSASTSSSAVAGTAALTSSSGSATAYYQFVPGSQSNSLTETFSIPAYQISTANTVTASSTALNAVVSFAPTGSTQIPNFVTGPSSTTTTLSSFTSCTTSLLFPFVTNQLGFDTGIAIANTSTDPFGSKGATPQAGTCTMNFYGNGAPSPANVTTASIPSGSVFTQVLSGVAAGFQGYIIAACTFQYAHGFAFITDGVGANGGLSQGYLAGVIPDVNQLARTTANPFSAGGPGTGESLGQ
jgi:hypothetical protein